MHWQSHRQAARGAPLACPRGQLNMSSDCGQSNRRAARAARSALCPGGKLNLSSRRGTRYVQKPSIAFSYCATPIRHSKFELSPILRDSQQSQLQAYWSRKMQPALLNYEQNHLDRGNIGDTTWKAAGIQSLHDGRKSSKRSFNFIIEHRPGIKILQMRPVVGPITRREYRNIQSYLPYMTNCVWVYSRQPY